MPVYDYPQYSVRRHLLNVVVGRWSRVTTRSQLTWYTIGLTYTAVAVAIRCMGRSSIPSHGDYTQSTAAKDLKDNLDVLSIAQTNLVVHDKGSGQTAALNAKYRTPVKRVVFRVRSPWLRL